MSDDALRNAFDIFCAVGKVCWRARGGDVRVFRTGEVATVVSELQRPQSEMSVNFRRSPTLSKLNP